MDYAELEALNISLLDQPGGKRELAQQLLRFINKNGTDDPRMGIGSVATLNINRPDT